MVLLLAARLGSEGVRDSMGGCGSAASRSTTPRFAGLNFRLVLDAAALEKWTLKLFVT